MSRTLDHSHGCRSLHQRRLRFSGGAAVEGTADGLGEAWYVIGGVGHVETAASETVTLRQGTAVWLGRSLRYRCRAQAGPDLEVLATSVWTGSPDDDTRPALHVTTLDTCKPERTGDREFRVLLSSGLAITQFVGLIPPGRAPTHSHTYDELVHVLAGRGVVHLGQSQSEIAPGTSVYLPPSQPHCLENTGSDMLQVLGVFFPAGSPAAKQDTAARA